LVVVRLLPVRLEGRDQLAVDVVHVAVRRDGDDRRLRRGAVGGDLGRARVGGVARAWGGEQAEDREQDRQSESETRPQRCAPFRGTGWKSNCGSISGGPVDRKDGTSRDTASVGTVSRTGLWISMPPGPVNQPGAARCLPEADLLGHLDLDDLAVLDDQQDGPEPQLSKD